MRHDLAACPVGTCAPRMRQSPRAAPLIARPGLAHAAPSGPLRTHRVAVHLSPVARRAHLHRRPTPRADELPGAALHGVLLAHRGLDTTPNECNTAPRTRAQHAVGRGGDSLPKCWSPSRSFPLELRTIMSAIEQRPCPRNDWRVIQRQALRSTLVGRSRREGKTLRKNNNNPPKTPRRNTPERSLTQDHGETSRQIVAVLSSHQQQVHLQQFQRNSHADNVCRSRKMRGHFGPTGSFYPGFFRSLRRAYGASNRKGHLKDWRYCNPCFVVSECLFLATAKATGTPLKIFGGTSRVTSFSTHSL